MKKTYFVFLFLIWPFLINAQEPAQNIVKKDHSNTDWFAEMQSKEPDYSKVKSLYDAYFLSHNNEKSVQRNLALRWLSVNSNNISEKGKVKIEPVSPKEMQGLMLLNSTKNNPKKQLRPSASPFPSWNDMTGSWRIIGPYHNKVVPCSNGYAMSGGFIDRVYINPYNTQNLFAGQSYGGLWVSKDQGQTWKLTDAEFPNGKNTYANRDVYYGEIEVSKTNSNLVFAATEAGVLKSTNGGDSWNLVNDLNYVSKSSERAYFLATANHDANLLLASYGNKIYRSSNGGLNWTMVFDNSTGGSNYSQGQHSTTGISARKYNFAGLSFHPTQNNIVYLAARNSSNQLVVHVSRDFGQTWRQLLNTNRTQNMKMEVMPSAPNKIYIHELFADLSSAQSRSGIIKYDTSGLKVQELKYPVVGHLLDDCTVSETDSSVIYLGGYSSGELHKSTDGGLTFVTNNPGFKNCTTGKYIHPDIRGIHAVGEVVFVGSDGGTSLSLDGSINFASVGQWISGIDLWGFSSAFKGDKLGSGDDHGPTEMRWFDGDGGWEHTGGADSKDITLNPAQPNWIYAMDIYRKFKMTTKESSYGTQESVVDASSFKYLAIHPNIYGKAFPFKDNNLLVSNDNMATVADTLFTFLENITKVKIPQKSPSVFYVLLNKNKVLKSTDHATTFNNITPSSTVSLGRTNITDIEVSNDGQTIWLSYGQVQNNCKVLRSTDGGTTWQNYSTGLPSPTASNITLQRGTNAGVYLSTDGGGVWYRDNSMNSWSLLGTGLPMLGYVTSSYVVPDKHVFRMGTGRGAFEHELAFNTAPDALIAVDYNTHTNCNRDTVYFRDFSAYQGTSNLQFLWNFEGGVPASSTDMNPKVRYLNSGIFDVSLQVTDANGNVSSHELRDFMTITDYNCGIDTLRGGALVSTGQSQYIRAKSPLPSSNNYTLMAWVKASPSNPNTAGILSLKNATSSWHLNTDSVIGDSTQIGFHPHWSWNSGLYIKHNQWHHVALVVEPSKVSIVRDGIRASRIGSTAPLLFDDFAIGTMQGAEWYRTFVGEIDEVAVYNRALTDEEIRKMMHLTKNNPKYPEQLDADLVSYYQFNENDLKLGVLDRVGTNDAKAFSSIAIKKSSAPIGSGVSETITAALPSGQTKLNILDLELKLPNTNKPRVPYTIYKLDGKPFPESDTVYNTHWIWRGWTSQKLFGLVDSIGLSAINLNASDLQNPGNYKMHFSGIADMNSSYVFRDIQAADSQGQSLSFTGLPINSFGQILLSRKPNPCVNNAQINQIANKRKQAIQSTNTMEVQGKTNLDTGSKLILNANNSILLLPSFEISGNTTFSAQISGCDSN